MRAAVVSSLLLLSGCGLSLDPRIDPQDERDAADAMDAGQGTDASAGVDASGAMDAGMPEDAGEASEPDAHGLEDAWSEDVAMSIDASEVELDASDVRQDAGLDAGFDAGDAGSDAGRDAGPDAPDANAGMPILGGLCIDGMTCPLGSTCRSVDIGGCTVSICTIACETTEQCRSAFDSREVLCTWANVCLGSGEMYGLPSC